MALSWEALAPRFRRHPLMMAKYFWPGTQFYNRQREAVHSVRDNYITVVGSANMMGKDYSAAFIVLWFFLTRHPCRVVTTSAKDDHLDVLWGEIGRFVQTSAVPLEAEHGGPLIFNHQYLGKIYNGQECEISYVKGLVASQDRLAAMQGHHATPTDPVAARDGVPRTLFVSDESSSVPDGYFTQGAVTWAKRMFIFGNCWACDNFFKHAIKGKPGTNDKGGDILAPDGKSYLRKVFNWPATDSPNVRLGFAERQMGKEASHRILVPGVKTLMEYERDLQLLDDIQKAVVLEARFYEGPDVMLFPSTWFDVAEANAEKLVGMKRRARAIGIDPGEGGANTAWAAVDEYGLIELMSMKTPDTDIIPRETIAFGDKHDVPPEKWIFDRGGGGKQHADRLRAMGYEVDSIGFGEAPILEPQHGRRQPEAQIEIREQRVAYQDRRAQMYGMVSMLLDPKGGVDTEQYGFISGWAVPAEYSEIRRQMSPIPKQYTSEGTLRLPPKNKKSANSKEKTLVELLGCSPDEADAVVLAVYGMILQPEEQVAGAM